MSQGNPTPPADFPPATTPAVGAGASAAPASSSGLSFRALSQFVSSVSRSVAVGAAAGAAVPPPSQPAAATPPAPGTAPGTAPAPVGANTPPADSDFLSWGSFAKQRLRSIVAGVDSFVVTLASDPIKSKPVRPEIDLAAGHRILDHYEAVWEILMRANLDIETKLKQCTQLSHQARSLVADHNAGIEHLARVAETSVPLIQKALNECASSVEAIAGQVFFLEEELNQLEEMKADFALHSWIAKRSEEWELNEIRILRQERSRIVATHESATGSLPKSGTLPSGVTQLSRAAPAVGTPAPAGGPGVGAAAAAHEPPSTGPATSDGSAPSGGVAARAESVASTEVIISGESAVSDDGGPPVEGSAVPVDHSPTSADKPAVLPEDPDVATEDPDVATEEPAAPSEPTAEGDSPIDEASSGASP
ncbi:hypothetical protein H696_05735 [Fonticula alba]|uniref:Uncharacterized protein n=1 Tax=Fonticula alba TaxID=691883 RepID=A0A058Z1H8_FONAL|nr:hypothetical protein H696_05735 [Fonticula alba]KCV67793.1 hypothetical protein H696_05735 [Fonticula alba]|eukprot:XP_009497824.1 hypothetical protein H696_05735 [Fonticula alba]